MTLSPAQRVMEMVDSQVAEHGFMMIGTVTNTDPAIPFTYTIGLTDRGWPEVILMGVNSQAAHEIIWTLVHQQEKRGAPYAAGDIVDIAEDKNGNSSRSLLRPVGYIGLDDYMCQLEPWAQRHNKGPVTALQIVIPDRDGRLPSEDGYDAAYMDKFQWPLNDAKSWTQL